MSAVRCPDGTPGPYDRAVGTAQRYDEVPYVSLPYADCRPDALAVVAHLAGLDLPDPAGWRVLDLGCGDATNLLAIAQAMPGARCVGVDGSAAAIERGRALARAAGLDVELLHGDLADLPDTLGVFDAVFVHGVWSWVGADLRALLPATVARVLAPRGVAYVSYLALPGHLLLAPARGLASRRARDGADPREKVAAARESVALALALRDGGAEDVFGQLLAAEKRRWEARPDFMIFHDVLDPNATAFALEDVAAAMAGAELEWLGEAQPNGWWPWRLDAEGAERLRTAAGPDRVARQQLFDDVQGVNFKASLFVHAGVAPAGEPDPARALDLLAAQPVRPPDDTPGGALERRLLDALELRPAPMAEIAAQAGVEPPVAAAAVLRLVTGKAATVHRLRPAWTADPRERPLASPLARVQATGSPNVTTLRHDGVSFNEDLGRALLLLLDGTRDRATLVEDLARAGGMDADSTRALEEGIDRALAAIGRMGLLLA